MMTLSEPKDAQLVRPSSLPSVPSKGINDTALRRFALLAAVKALGRIRPRVGTILLLTKGLCVKYGPLRQLSEASTLRFVAEHTSIPVPKVHCAFVHQGSTYILMDRVPGETLAHEWSSRSPESKTRILAQLKRMLQELRSLPAPGPRVANVDGGPLYDCRFPGNSLTVGPFENIHDFHCFLREYQQASSRQFPDVNRMISLQDRPWLLPVFTHGDLSSLNVLVLGDHVVGIVDWESAGWYPSYWEYSMASHANPRNVFWREEVGKFLEMPMPEDLEMEQLRLQYFGDV